MKLRTFSDILEIRSGRNQKDVLNPNGKYPILGSAGKVMGYADKFICEENTTIIGRKGTINNPMLIREKFWNVDTAFGLHALNELDKKYLFYFCQSFDFTKLDKGSGRPSLVKSDLLKIKMYCPEIDEQKQIVEILDTAFEAIEKAKTNLEKNLKNTKELFDSKLNEIFSQKGEGWEEKTLGEVCSVLNGYAFKSNDVIENSNTQLVRMGNLYQNKFNLDRKTVFYPDSFTKKYSEYLLEEGDLIMSLTGTVGKRDYGYTVEVPSLKVKLLLNQRIMKISIRDVHRLNKSYLHFLLLSPFFLEKLFKTANGTRQANLSSRTILMLKIFIPISINEQLKIVKKLRMLKQQTKQLEQKYQQKLDNLEELKKSLLQKAFSGELIN